MWKPVLNFEVRSKYFARDVVYFFGGFKVLVVLLETFFLMKKFQAVRHYVFGKIVTRGNAVQIFPNFPAKRLSIYKKENFAHLLIS